MDATIVTYEKYPDLAPDDHLFRSALERCGAVVRTSVWSDPSVDWSLSPVTVIRAAWDYPHRYDEFLAWLAHVETRTRLVNDARTVRWNVHKRYLADLEGRGIAIVPTVFVNAASDAVASDLCAARGWCDVVMKPCVGGSSFMAARFAGDAIAAAGNEHLRELLARGDAMIQPYLEAVESEGERSVIAIDGTITHAVAKATFNSSTVTTTERRHEPTPQERAFVDRVLAAAGGAAAYARVDVIPSPQGPLLLELELVEPTLYLSFEPSSAERLARSILGKGSACART